jgi:hypothetical protein
MPVTMTFAPNTRRIHVSTQIKINIIMPLTRTIIGIKEVVTLTSDLSRKNLEKDFERMDTPQGTFYRMSTIF